MKIGKPNRQKMRHGGQARHKVRHGGRGILIRGQRSFLRVPLSGIPCLRQTLISGIQTAEQKTHSCRNLCFHRQEHALTTTENKGIP